MSKQVLDYSEVLLDLERRRVALVAEIDAAIAAIRPLADAQIQQSVTRLEGLTVVAPDKPYAKLSIAGAARKHLEAIGKPQTTAEICEALGAGGYQTESVNFSATVFGSLRRRPADFKRIRKKWKLVKNQPDPT